MKVLIIAALVAIAAARPEYHDDVFHFSTLDGLKGLSGGLTQTKTIVQKVAQPAFTQQYTVSQPAYTQQYTVQKPVFAQQYTVQKYAQPAYTQQITVQKPAFNQYTVQKIAQPVYSQVQVAQPVYSQIQTQQIAQPAVYSQSFGGQNQYIRIVKQRQEVDPTGFYLLSYETENGIKADEQGTVNNAGSKDESIAKEGSYSYTGPDGVVYTINYVADENGFRASGAHIPVPPPIPAEIQRSLELNAAEGDKYDESRK